MHLFLFSIALRKPDTGPDHRARPWKTTPGVATPRRKSEDTSTGGPVKIPERFTLIHGRSKPKLDAIMEFETHDLDGQGRKQSSALSDPTPHSLLAWFVIVAITIAIVVMHVLGGDATSTSEVAEQNLMDRLEGQTAVGMYQFQGGVAASPTVKKFERGSMSQRLRGVVLRGALWDPSEARGALFRVEAEAEEAGYDPTESQIETMHLLGQLYADPQLDDRGALTEAQRVELVDQLGWFGELALAFDSSDAEAREQIVRSANRIAITLTLVAVGGVGAFIFGFILLVLVIIFACLRKLPHRFGAARSTDGLLAEAFALWLVCFLGLHVLLELLMAVMPGLGPHALGVTGLVHCITAFVVLWPVARGVDWHSVRHSIGWTRGVGLWKEIGLGICGWFMTLPLLGIGVLLMLLLMAISGGQGEGTGFEPTSQPVHPIITSVAEGNIWGLVQVYFVAAVVAPFLEETVFRGLLYRQLRSASGAWPIVGSIACSAIVVSVVFAALHPQGLVAVPALAALAIGMTLMREWRGSLVSPMVMHACNNSMMITLMLVLFS
jgi:membrane protease YdiL (CAAX protease family)